jgi:transposase
LVEGVVARVEVLEAENAALRADNARLRTENTALKRRLGINSTNSSTPPSQDSLAAKGKRRAQLAAGAVEGSETGWAAGR